MGDVVQLVALNRSLSVGAADYLSHQPRDVAHAEGDRRDGGAWRRSSVGPAQAHPIGAGEPRPHRDLPSSTERGPGVPFANRALRNPRLVRQHEQEPLMEQLTNSGYGEGAGRPQSVPAGIWGEAHDRGGCAPSPHRSAEGRRIHRDQPRGRVTLSRRPAGSSIAGPAADAVLPRRIQFRERALSRPRPHQPGEFRLPGSALEASLRPLHHDCE